MCNMTSTANTAQTGEARMTVLKRLLKDASPKNPTYILGRIIANFKAQSSTELTVRHGDEVFILFEINDWAFATLLSDSNRKGYVPLDYCDVIKDFYESSQSDSTPKTQTRCLGNSVKIREDTTSQKLKSVAESNIRELAYYETKLKRQSSCKKPLYAEHRVSNAHRTDRKADIFHKIEHGEDDFSMSHQQRCSLPSTDTHCSSRTTCNSRCTELYGEQTNAVRSHNLSRGTDCCCCCEKRKCRSSRQERYDNVLHYLRDSHPAESHCDDSESGLGDSESIISLSDAHTGKAHIDLNDMSTQTSQSLENLQKQLELMSADLDQAASELKCDRLRKEKLNKAMSCDDCLSSSNYSMTSSQPSLDSLLSDPVATTIVLGSSGLDSDDTDQESTSSFDREDYNTVKRRTSKTDENTQVESVKAETASKQFASEEPARSSSAICQSTQLFTPDKRKLSLPILENGKVPNRVELCQLSARIKDKLKPTRDELLHNRTKEHQTSIVETATKDSSTCKKEIPSLNTTTALPAGSESVDSPSTPHSVEIKQRKMTLQAIQEQYMKLEEARLLHNALKHLNDTMHASEHLDTSTSS